MKNITLILVMCCFVSMLQAQIIVDKHFDFNNKKTVVLNLQITDSINIQTWNKNEVYAYASININENKDNEAYETTFDESGDKVEIKAKFKSNYFSNKKCCCESEIAWKIMIPENAEISVETINGNIIINGKTTWLKVHTISGFIDLSVPANKKANLEMKTISGNIYTNLELASTTQKRVAELKISDNLNGGGVPIDLETISGDIFLRKM